MVLCHDFEKMLEHFKWICVCDTSAQRLFGQWEDRLGSVRAHLSSFFHSKLGKCPSSQRSRCVYQVYPNSLPPIKGTLFISHMKLIYELVYCRQLTKMCFLVSECSFIYNELALLRALHLSNSGCFYLLQVYHQVIALKIVISDCKAFSHVEKQSPFLVFNVVIAYYTEALA